MALARHTARLVCITRRRCGVGRNHARPDLDRVLMMEPTGHARAAIVPLLLAVAIATLVARLIEPRSIYDARLTDAQVRDRQRMREQAPEKSSTS